MLPTKVTIVSPESAYEGDRIRLICSSQGSKPPARLTWSVGEEVTDPEKEVCFYLRHLN